MQVSETGEIEGRRIVSQIGPVEAATPWRLPGNDENGVNWKARALEKLMQTASEFDADAIIEVGFSVDGLKADHFSSRLERTCAKGVAVRLAKG